MQHYYSEFFTQYCRFISKDLLATFDKRLGRNTKMIYVFYKVFFVINKNGAPKTTITEALSLLSTQVDNYLSDGDTSIYSEMNTNLDCTNKLYVKSLSYLGHLMSPLNDFNEAISLSFSGMSAIRLTNSLTSLSFKFIWLGSEFVFIAVKYAITG